MQPQIFQKMRADLAFMWSTSSREGSTKKICAKANFLPLNDKSSFFDYEGLVAIDEDVTSMKVILYLLLSKYMGENLLQKKFVMACISLEKVVAE